MKETRQTGTLLRYAVSGARDALIYMGVTTGIYLTWRIDISIRGAVGYLVAISGAYLSMRTSRSPSGSEILRSSLTLSRSRCFSMLLNTIVQRAYTTDTQLPAAGGMASMKMPMTNYVMV